MARATARLGRPRILSPVGVGSAPSGPLALARALALALVALGLALGLVWLWLWLWREGVGLAAGLRAAMGPSTRPLGALGQLGARDHGPRGLAGFRGPEKGRRTSDFRRETSYSIWFGGVTTVYWRQYRRPCVSPRGLNYVERANCLNSLNRRADTAPPGPGR